MNIAIFIALMIFGAFCLYTAGVTYGHSRTRAETPVATPPALHAPIHHRTRFSLMPADLEHLASLLARALPRLTAAMRHSSGADLEGEAEFIAEVRKALDEHERLKIGEVRITEKLPDLFEDSP